MYKHFGVTEKKRSIFMVYNVEDEQLSKEGNILASIMTPHNSVIYCWIAIPQGKKPVHSMLQVFESIEIKKSPLFIQHKLIAYLQ